MKYENPDTTLEMLIGILKNKIPKLKEQYPEVHKQLGIIQDNLHKIALVLYDK